MTAPTPIKLTPEELADITGYTQPCRQLSVLRKRGFSRAYIARKGGVVLERVHYETVSRGETEPTGKTARLSIFKASR